MWYTQACVDRGERGDNILKLSLTCPIFHGYTPYSQIHLHTLLFLSVEKRDKGSGHDHSRQEMTWNFLISNTSVPIDQYPLPFILELIHEEGRRDPCPDIGALRMNA